MYFVMILHISKLSQIVRVTLRLKQLPGHGEKKEHGDAIMIFSSQENENIFDVKDQLCVVTFTFSGEYPVSFI